MRNSQGPHYTKQASATRAVLTIVVATIAAVIVAAITVTAIIRGLIRPKSFAAEILVKICTCQCFAAH